MPLPACLVTKDLSIMNVNNAFEASFGLAPVSLVNLAECSGVKLLEDITNDVVDVLQGFDFDIGVRGNIGNSNWKGRAIKVAGDLFFLSGVLSQVEDNLDTVPVHDEMSEDLTVDNFPLIRKGVIDIFQNAAFGVHCTSGKYI